MQNILVTGATGFIGKNLIEKIISEHKYQIIAYIKEDDTSGKNFLLKNGVNNIVNDKTLNSINSQIDYCVHLASYGVSYGTRNVDLMLDVNVKLAAKIMELCSKRNCKLFINTGSCFEYGSSLSKTRSKETDALLPQDIYAASKVSAEIFLKVYSSTLNQKVITIRPFGIFGKYEPLSRITPLIFDAGFYKKTIGLTLGEQIRDYLDVKDVVNAIYCLIENEQRTINGEAINICSGIPISIRSYINEIISSCHFDEKLFIFGSMEYRKDESMFFVGDNSRLRSLIGSFESRESLDDKIRGAFYWFKSM